MVLHIEVRLLPQAQMPGTVSERNDQLRSDA